MKGVGDGCVVKLAVLVKDGVGSGCSDADEEGETTMPN